MKRLDNSVLLQLKRWNTPTIYNGWEQITSRDACREGFNLEECRDFMPQMGPMVGYAVTVQIQPGNREHVKRNPNAWSEYRSYIASIPAPKIVIVQDIDKPNCYGAFWGEVNSNIHKSLGCVGTITDGAIRDVDEMTNAGFKAIARRMCVGHAASWPVKWNCDVEVFGRKVQPGQLIHADKHGFIVIPDDEQDTLIEAAVFMDTNECRTVIDAARFTFGKTPEQILGSIDAAGAMFGKNAKEKFGARGEW